MSSYHQNIFEILMHTIMSHCVLFLSIHFVFVFVSLFTFGLSCMYAFCFYQTNDFCAFFYEVIKIHLFIPSLSLSFCRRVLSLHYSHSFGFLSLVIEVLVYFFNLTRNEYGLLFRILFFFVVYLSPSSSTIER